MEQCKTAPTLFPNALLAQLQLLHGSAPTAICLREVLAILDGVEDEIALFLPFHFSSPPDKPVLVETQSPLRWSRVRPYFAQTQMPPLMRIPFIHRLKRLHMKTKFSRTKRLEFWAPWLLKAITISIFVIKWVKLFSDKDETDFTAKPGEDDDPMGYYYRRDPRIYQPARNVICEEPTGDSPHIFGTHDICFDSTSSRKVITFMQLLDWNDVELCAIITASKHNPTYGICVLQLDNIRLNAQQLSRLKSVRNMQIMKLDARQLFKDTSIEKRWDDGCFGGSLSSQIPIPRLLETLGLLYLYKYGGIFMDSNVLTLKSFDNFTNTVGIESGKSGYIGSTVMIFDRGNRFVGDVIEAMPRHIYVPSVLTSIYYGDSKKYLVDKPGSVHVVPPKVFYPVPLSSACEKFYRASSRAAVGFQFRHTIVVHSMFDRLGMDVSRIERKSFIGSLLRQECAIIV